MNAGHYEVDIVSILQEIWSLDNKCRLKTDALLNEKELEDILCEHIEILNRDWLVVGRQVRTSAGKMIDILCIDRDGDRIIIELKKDLTPREVTAQTIDYASCVDQMGLEELAEIYLAYKKCEETLNCAYENKFSCKLDEDTLSQSVKMVIVASKMDDSTERIVTYLRKQYMVDINILFFNVFQHNGQRILSRAWFQEDVELQKVPATSQSVSWNHEYYVSFGPGARKWTDARKYGFISAGGGTWYTNTLKMLSVGDRVWVNIPHTGYVGVGTVNAEVQLSKDCMLMVDGSLARFDGLKLEGDYFYSSGDPECAEYIVGVDWKYTVLETEAAKEAGFFGNQNTVCRPANSKWNFTIERLKQLWSIE